MSATNRLLPAQITSAAIQAPRINMHRGTASVIDLDRHCRGRIPAQVHSCLVVHVGPYAGSANRAAKPARRPHRAGLTRRRRKRPGQWPALAGRQRARNGSAAAARPVGTVRPARHRGKLTGVRRTDLRIPVEVVEDLTRPHGPSHSAWARIWPESPDSRGGPSAESAGSRGTAS